MMISRLSPLLVDIRFLFHGLYVFLVMLVFLLFFSKQPVVLATHTSVHNHVWV